MEDIETLTLPYCEARVHQGKSWGERINMRVPLLILGILIAVSCAKHTPRKCDGDRIADINSIASIMEEYHDRYGSYPFSEQWLNVEPGKCAVSVYILITDHRLSENQKYIPGVSCRSISKQMFQQYLSDKLNRPIVLPVDERPLKKALPYQFLFDGTDYFVSCVLTQATERTRQVARNSFKYQLSSTAIPERSIFRYIDIKQAHSSQAFQASDTPRSAQPDR